MVRFPSLAQSRAVESQVSMARNTVAQAPFPDGCRNTDAVIRQPLVLGPLVVVGRLSGPGALGGSAAVPRPHPAMQLSPGAPPRFSVVVPELLTPFDAVVQLLDPRLHGTAGDRQSQSAVAGVVDPLAVVGQIRPEIA